MHAQEALTSALEKSGENKAGFTAMLGELKKDKEKYDAACFLISNMVWHQSSFKVNGWDTNMLHYLHVADSIYYSVVRDLGDSELYNPEFNKALSVKDQEYRKLMESQHFTSPSIEEEDMPDISCLSAAFLRQQIEHAFKLKNGQFAKDLGFQDFLEYILPYRAMDGTFPDAAFAFHNLFAKYLHVDTAQSIRNVVWRYNVTSDRLRYWGGSYPFRQPAGFYEKFFLNIHDCVGLAETGVQALRACGIPAAVEYNVAYKFWSGRHYHASVLTPRGWETFSPESETPVLRNPKFAESLNIYRIMYSAQEDSPFFLRSSGEPIPMQFSNPCIRDVSSEILQTVQLTLPFHASTTHRLAYLASFSSQNFGLVPVTWGVIDHAQQTVTFQNVVLDNIYFPIYLDEEEYTCAFAAPFKLLSAPTNGYRMEQLPFQQGAKVSATIERKFPRKPSMKRIAEQTVGTFVIASNDRTFSSADTLGVIASIPDTKWEDLELAISHPYQFYRICGTGTPAKVYLSEICFLSKASHNYTNVMSPPVPGRLGATNDKEWVRLLDEPLEKCKWKAEYDGNPQTAPEQWPDVTLSLQEPQYVERIRYMVKHADNEVKPLHKYELYVWNNGYWKKFGMLQQRKSIFKSMAYHVVNSTGFIAKTKELKSFLFSLIAKASKYFPMTIY